MRIDRFWANLSDLATLYLFLKLLDNVLSNKKLIDEIANGLELQGKAIRDTALILQGKKLDHES